MLAGQAGPVDAESAFEEQFAQLAQNHFMTKFPELADLVTNFKVLDTDLDEDRGVGAFLLSLGASEVHIPVVAIGGKIEPVDLMYVPDIGAFLPFDEEWLGMVETLRGTPLGEATKAPRMLQTDVDIRNVVVPPMTGRYSYASERIIVGKMTLPNFLAQAPNTTKQACIALFKRRPKIAQYAFDRYGVDCLKRSLQPSAEKRASAEPAVLFCDSTTPPAAVTEIFREKNAAAMHSIMVRGYAVHDTRPRPKVAVFKEHLVRLTSLERPGIYTLYLKSGETRTALVIPNPARLSENLRYYRRGSPERKKIPEQGSPASPDDKKTALIYTDQGELGFYDSFNSAPRLTLGVIDDETFDKGAIEKILSGASTAPKTGRGFFFNIDENRFTASEPMTISSVSMKGDGTKLLKGSTSGPAMGQDIVVRMGPDYRYKQISVLQTGGEYPEVRVPDHFKFISASKELRAEDIAASPTAVQEIIDSRTKKAGIDTIRVHDALGGEFAVNGIAMSKVAAIKHLIVDHDLSVRSSENLVRMAEKTGRAHAYTMTTQELRKVAQEGVNPEGQMPPEMAGAPPEAAGAPPEGMPPEMAGMPPEMAGGMMPPMPSPLDQAVQEVMTLISAQGEEIQTQLQQQLQLVDAQMQAVSQVMQRAQEISAGAPPLQYGDIRAMVGAAPPPAGAPAQAPAGGMPPDMMPPEGMPPEGMPPGMPPEGMPPVGDGTVEDAMALSEAGMAGPGPAGEMAGPEDPNAFDAAAISSLISQDDIDDVTMEQLPQLRNTLDAISKILLEMRIKAPTLVVELGDQKYDEMTNKLQRVLDALGSVVLSLYKKNLILQKEL